MGAPFGGPPVDPDGEPRAKKRRFPARLAWQEGDPIPPGYEPKRRPSLGLLITGAVLFGTAYLPSLAVAASSDQNDDEYLPLAIPFAGPFVTMATVPSEGAGTFWLAIDGIVQVTGASLFVASFVAKQSYLRRVGEGPQAPPEDADSGLEQVDLRVGAGSAFLQGAF